MSQQPVIKINPAKQSDLEFDVTIQGMDTAELPVVKFVITSEEAQCEFAFRCTKLEGPDVKHRWLAKLPALQYIKESEVKFHVEVIVEGYYFEPAAGTVQLIAEPGVKFPPSTVRPTVTTSFTVRQDTDKDDPKPETKSKRSQKVEESGEITGQYAPTNGLLKPEYAPPQSHVKTPNAEKDDLAIDMSKLASHVTPGETTDPEPESDNKSTDQFDPAQVADAIVRSTVGRIEKPATPGMFFKRRSDGTPIVQGLDSVQDATIKRLKAERVKEILDTQ